MKKIFILIAIGGMSLACGSSKGSSNTNSTEISDNNGSAGDTKTQKLNQEDYKDDPLLVRIELGACFGRCPVEKFSIFADGSFEYEGINNTDKMGDFTGTIKASEVDEIYDMMSKLKIDEYPEKFGYAVSDISTKAIIFHFNGKRKKIIFKQNEGRTELKDFITRVRGIMAGGKYKRKVKE